MSSTISIGLFMIDLKGLINVFKIIETWLNKRRGSNNGEASRGDAWQGKRGAVPGRQKK
jgi:hypothetical protein